MTASIPKLTGAACLVLCLNACWQEEGAVRAGSQPLDKLITPEVQRRALAQAVPSAAQARQAQGMCAEVLRVSQRGQLILNRAIPGRVTVNSALWSRVPEEAQQAILRCDQATRPNPAQPIAVVQAAAPE